jgi:uncharacterized protein YbjT (DUF2867 family)
MTIILAGGSGLIGQALAKKLEGPDLRLITRRQSDASAEQIVAPVEAWPEHIGASSPGIAISTLGTTIKQAGSQAAFQAVDHGLVISVAQAAKDAGARHFIMVTSVGASAKSSNFYIKTKGETEEAVKAMGFDRVDILRPGLLKGNRQGPSRPMESLMIMLSPITDLFTPAVLSQYRSIEAQDVANAIAKLTKETTPGTFVHHNDEMLALSFDLR